MNDKRNCYSDLDSGFSYLLVLVVPTLVGFLLSMIFGWIALSNGLEKFTQSSLLYCLYMVLVNGSLVATYFVYNKATRTNYVKASLLKPKAGAWNYVISAGVSLITLFGSLYLVNYLTFLMQQIGYNPDASLPLPLTNAGWLVLNLVILAVIPAICEELVYRGIVFNGLRKFGTCAAVFLSALLFALAHGSAMQFFYQFILGLVLAALVAKTGSIVVSMVAHFVNNATVIVVNYISLNTGFLAEETVFSWWVVLIAFVAAAVAGAVVWAILHFLAKEKKQENEISQNDEYILQAKQPENKKFSSKKSLMVFLLSLALAIAIWCVGTFC